MPAGTDLRPYVIDSRAGRLDSMQLRAAVCSGDETRPDYRLLDEGELVRFLQRQRFEIRVEKQSAGPRMPPLSFVFVTVPRLADPVTLRVAVLPNADAAGYELHRAVMERGAGAWGVHRSNLAVLGPSAPSAHDIAFAAMTKLACWGTLTIAGADDAFVIPGGYAEP